MRVISRGRDLHLARWLALHPGWYCGLRPATATSALIPSGRQAPPPGRAERKEVMRTATQVVLDKTCNAGTNLSGPCNTDADCPGAAAGSCAGSNKCHGGPNDGMACTPADSIVGTLSDFPTTHDCPPPAVNDIGGLPIAFALTTGSTSKTGQTISGQGNVICGFCRDVNSTFTGCFEGDTTAGCPTNTGCTAAATPFPCCTGIGTGSCNQPPHPCFIGNGGSPSACTDGNSSWPDCQQRNPGAFGPAGGGARTITETGAAGWEH